MTVDISSELQRELLLLDFQQINGTLYYQVKLSRGRLIKFSFIPHQLKLTSVVFINGIWHFSLNQGQYV